MTSSQMQTNNEPDQPVLYQVDCTKAFSGKTVSTTKRRIRWRFGYANSAAIADGATSVECRGSEHEITLVWSITSGKKLIIHDSKEVHYSQGRRAEGKFQFCWKSRNHVFTVIAHAAPPLGKARAHWKQYDLLIDGCSFDNLPRIFQLGLNMNRSRSQNYANSASSRSGLTHHHRSPTTRTSNANASTLPSYDRRSDVPSTRSPQDEMNWARGIHTIESRRQMNANVNVISRDDSAEFIESAPAPPQDLLSGDNANDLNSPRDLMSEAVPAPVDGAFNSFSQQAASPFEYDQNDQFNPQNDNDQFNPHVAPSYDAIWSSIMDAYDNDNENADMNSSQPVSNIAPTTMPVLSTSVSHVQTMHSLTIDTATDKWGVNQPNMESPTDVTAMDGAMNHLVNLDDISQPVLKEYNRGNITRNDVASRKHLSLVELKKENKAPVKEIMKTHVVYAQTNPGALVVYGQPQQQQYSNYGPPPLSYGFGVNASYEYR